LDKQPRNYRECDVFKGDREQYLRTNNVKCSGRFNVETILWSQKDLFINQKKQLYTNNLLRYCRNCPILQGGKREDKENRIYIPEVKELSLFAKFLALSDKKWKVLKKAFQSIRKEEPVFMDVPIFPEGEHVYGYPCKDDDCLKCKDVVENVIVNRKGEPEPSMECGRKPEETPCTKHHFPSYSERCTECSIKLSYLTEVLATLDRWDEKSKNDPNEHWEEKRKSYSECKPHFHKIMNKP
jgi:hypothetical protein